VLGGLPALTVAQERIVHTVPVGANWETWRIEQPNVRRAITGYPQIRFSPGDRVTVDAGGCVQTGGSGSTWKRYVTPLDHIYSCDPRYAGVIHIPGTTLRQTRIADLVGRPFDVVRRTYLVLGYLDDHYGDNGYSDHDDGTFDQCAGVGNAFVEITIVHTGDLLTGIWRGDDGGVYYVRQAGGRVWWVGFNTSSPEGASDFQNGLVFTNVFEGWVALHSNTVAGQWADVPRGTTLQYGDLTFDILRTSAGIRLRKRSSTGGFGGRLWTRSPLLPDRGDIAARFCGVQRNDEHSLAATMSNGGPFHNGFKENNGGLFKDDTVVYGWITGLPVVNFPGNDARITFRDGDCPQRSDLPIARSYARFMCADFCPFKWFNGGWGSDPPDGDLHFEIEIQRGLLDLTPGPEWLNPPEQVRDKLDRTGSIIHAEALMYGRAAGTNRCAAGERFPSLLPGWADRGANSVLLNGQPLDGGSFERVVVGTNNDIFTDENVSSGVDRLLDWAIDWGSHPPGPKVLRARTPTEPGQMVRITGVLAIDEHPADDPNQKVEIHPVYSMDFITDSASTDLTGVWGSNDDGTYYVRQIGNVIWWLGLSRDRGRTFANVFHGTIDNLSITGEWADVPLGRTRNAGMVRVNVDQVAIDPGAPPTVNWRQLRYVDSTGGFGGRSWDKLYEPDNR
jgi:hypothetical protein